MTYSFAAHDPASGEVGAAVQSHWFSVGSVVSWAQAGRGAVCTQSIAERAYGPRLLERLGAGEAPADALAAELGVDDQARFRQVAVVDVHGRVAVHTGDGCIAHAGHRSGDGWSAQANMMAAPTVWDAMAHRFAATEGPLARRLLAALHAAEEEGGDARGRQSAALVVAPADGEPWRVGVDLRVEDHPEPLEELGRLLDLHDAYAAATRGDELTGQGRHDEAAREYERAGALAPDNHELLFWAGLAAAQAGDLDRALERVRAAIAAHPGWRTMLERLAPEVAPSAAAVRAALER